MAEKYWADISGLVNWLNLNQHQQTGLPYSHVGDERFRNWVMTYDAAVSALAYIAVDELDRARKIINFYRQNDQTHRLGGIIEGVIPLSEYTKGVDYSVRTGANLWLGIASFHLYRKSKELKYLEFAKQIADFAISLQNTDKQSQNYGGVSLGPAGETEIKGDQHIGHNDSFSPFTEVYATEINIDYYALLNMLYKETKEKHYNDAYKLALVWLKSNGYNYNAHRFNRGFNDIHVATDVQSWGISALGVEGLNAFEENAAKKIIEFVEKNCISEDEFKKPDGTIVKIEGADFIDKNQAGHLNRPPLVSPEWTYQLINTYLSLARYYDNKGNSGMALTFNLRRDYLIENMLKLAVHIDGTLAYPYATQAEAELGHENRTPREANYSSIGISYGILALKKFEPLIMD